jgi:hypothetical protein
MNRLGFVVSVVGLVGFASPLARAQGSDTLTVAQRAGAALARLGAGQHVRLWQKRVYFERRGEVVNSSAKLLTLRTDGSSIEVPASDVDSLWVRYGDHAGKGALIGAVVAGLAMGAFFVALSQANCEGQQSCSGPGAFALGLVLGGAMGGGVGALIGAVTPRWQQQVP